MDSGNCELTSAIGMPRIILARQARLAREVANAVCRSEIHRRDFLEKSLCAATAAGLGLRAGGSPAADDESLFIAGYPNPMSCEPGQQVALHVSTNAKTFSLEIAREGAEREIVWTKEDLPGAEYPAGEGSGRPGEAAMNGCAWPAALKLTIPESWRSGYYSVTMRGTSGTRRTQPVETFFVVRSAVPGGKAKILLELATNTYHAYNNWGGSCLYSGPKFPRVSFDRPISIYETPLLPGRDWYNPNTNCAHTWELPFIRWAERAGYQLDLCCNLDLELHPQLLPHYRLVLSVGHDEYWSAGMRDNLETFIANGGNVAFLSGNTCCWQVRVEDHGRALVCHKRACEDDPAYRAGQLRGLTTLWSDPRLCRPENQLTGVGFVYGGYNGLFGEFMDGPGAGTYAVHRPDHWIFAGTGLKQGDTFGSESGIAGYECDGCEFVLDGGRPVPTGRDGTPRNLEILATAPARWSPRDGSLGWARQLRAALPAAQVVPDDFVHRDGAAVLGIYSRGGTVVTVGSTDWSDVYGQTIQPTSECCRSLDLGRRVSFGSQTTSTTMPCGLIGTGRATGVSVAGRSPGERRPPLNRGGG